MRTLFALGLMGAGLAHVCSGQSNNTFSLSVNSAPGDGSLSLNLWLTSGGAPAPTALQWTVDYPASEILSFSAVEGPAAIAAEKTVVCSGNRCMLWGLNVQPIKSGVVAVITARLASDAPAIVNFRLSGLLGASAQAEPISITSAADRFPVISRSPALPQGAAANAVPVGSLAELATGAGWDTTVHLLNLGATTALARLRFFAEDGIALPLPLVFPQGPDPSAILLASSLDQVIAPGATLIVANTGLDVEPLRAGSAQLLADGKVDGFAIFSVPALKWAAAVPLETRQAAAYVLAFDNTGPLATGVAIANVAEQSANVSVIIRADTGTPIGTATLSLPARGHRYFMLDGEYPVTANKRGTIEFDPPPGGQISVLGVRANGSSLTTLPVLANVGTSGGAIAHSAYNGGFTSSYYLVNTGAASASFVLRFFDDSGNAQQVPLSLPQSGKVASASILTQTLAPGAMLEIDTQARDDLPLVQGSAQLIADGNISGFEVFRWTRYGQEASVPLESRTPGSFVLAFDNTSERATGAALANLSNTPANITATFHDDAGMQIGTTESISLAAHGHTSFMLADRYPAVAGKRGIVEFAVPPGMGLAVIGLGAKSDGSLTTIPVLTK